MSIRISESKLNDYNAAFSNNAAANTQVTIDVVKPNKQTSSEHMLIVYNPSTETDLTVKLFAVESGLGGSDRNALITSITVPKAQSVTGTSVNTYAVLVQALLNGTNLKIVISNNTAVGAAGAFTAAVRIREEG